jgi:hypothetical protein
VFVQGRDISLPLFIGHPQGTLIGLVEVPAGLLTRLSLDERVVELLVSSPAYQQLVFEPS